MTKVHLIGLVLSVACAPGLSYAQYSAYGRTSIQPSNSAAQHEREREQERERQRREAEQERQRREAEQERQRRAQEREEEQAREKERQASREREARQERERHAQQDREREAANARRERQEREKANTANPQQAGRGATPAGNASSAPRGSNSSSHGAMEADRSTGSDRQPRPPIQSGTTTGSAATVRQGFQSQTSGMPSHAGSTTSSASNGPTGEEVRTRPGVAVNRPLYSPPPVSTAASSANSRPLAQPLASPSSAFRGNEGQPIQRGYGDNAYRPVGTAPRVDPSRPLTYQTMSYLNPSNPQSSGTVDGKANAPSPAQRASNQPAASGGATNGASTPAPGKSSYRKEPQTVPELPLAEGLKKPNGEYNCGPINAYAGQYEKQAGARALAVINAPYRSEARCTARCDALAWREEVLSKYQYTGSWSCSSAAVRMWNAVGPNYTGYNNGNNGDGCTCVGSNGAPLAFSPEPK